MSWPVDLVITSNRASRYSCNGIGPHNPVAHTFRSASGNCYNIDLHMTASESAEALPLPCRVQTQSNAAWKQSNDGIHVLYIYTWTGKYDISLNVSYRECLEQHLSFICDGFLSLSQLHCLFLQVLWVIYMYMYMYVIHV